jgi:diguanylate cyclase (GGDEF)-like protein
VTPTDAKVPPRTRSLVTEVLGVQLAIAALIGVIALLGLAWTSGSVIRNNLEHWATQWANELNELGAPFYLADSSETVLDVERFVAKYPEIERVSWYDADGRALQSLKDTNPSDAATDPIDAQQVAELTALAGTPRPYQLTQDAASTQRYRLLGPIWTESLPGDGLFDLDLKAPKTSVRLLGFVSVDLDFSSYQSAFLPRLALASAVLLALLVGSWALGRWFLKRALAPLSALQGSLARLAAGETDLKFPASPHSELDAIVTALENTTHALQKRERHLLHLVNHDQLTGLPNRHRLIAELDAAMAKSATDGMKCALFFVDLDQFKYVNDTCGHASGDHLLQLAAQQLRYAVRPDDLVARFGGDEFVVLLRNVSRTDAKLAAAKVLELMRGLKHVEQGQVFHLQCSIGVATFGGARFGAQEIIAQADMACQTAKAHGRNRVEFYSTAGKQSEQMARDIDWMNRLRAALEHDGFELHYQPLLHIESGTVEHYEALLRLKTEHGLVSPPSFLPAAVRFGLMADIDRCVLRRAVSALGEFQSTRPQLTLSVNLSGFAFEDDSLGSYVKRLLDEHGVSGERLVIEITEQLAVRFAANTDKQIALLRELGCRLAIDDFGTGYSSFSYLKRLPVDYLKIDGSFIRGLPRDRVDQAMVRMVGEVARAAGMRTVAEYVHSATTLTLLSKYGIDYAQGFYIGKATARPEPVTVEWQHAEQRLRLER